MKNCYLLGAGMWRRQLLFGALLTSACNGAPTSFDPLMGPKRGPNPIPGEGGGGGTGGSAVGLDGGAGGSVMTGMGDGGDDGGDSDSSDNGGTGGGSSAADSALEVSPQPDAVAPVDSSIVDPTCPGGTKDLSNVAGGDFEIAFHLVTREMRLMAVLNQRLSCGYGMFWDIRMSPAGAILVEIDGNTADSYQFLKSKVAVNDGNPHDVIVTRAAGRLTIRIDGAAAGERESEAQLGVLPPLLLGGDVCIGQITNPPNVPFNGTLSGVCITK